MRLIAVVGGLGRAAAERSLTIPTYVGVKIDPVTCPSGLNATCGKPLMNLNIPAWCGPGTPNTCPTGPN